MVNTIEAKRLTKYYGSTRAIEGVTFNIEKGQVIGFLGPNGAGKSTTLKILSGLIPASSGEAWVCGLSVANNPQKTKELIGYMPENNPLPEDLRVYEYLRYRAHLKGVPFRQVKSRVEEVMEICDLHRKARSRIIGVLSKGFKQRVGIADVILSKPEVVIMDEPTIGLDPHQILSIRKLIDQLKDNHTIIISSHILPEIEGSCSKVIIINHGHIVAYGSRKELRQKFVPYTEFLIEIKCDIGLFTQQLKEYTDSFKISYVKAIPNSDYHTVSLHTLSHHESPENFLKWAASHPSWALRGFKKTMPTLEDIFMIATKRSWEERTLGHWHPKHKLNDTHLINDNLHEKE